MSTNNIEVHSHERFGKYDCVETVMEISPVMEIERKKWDVLGILNLPMIYYTYAYLRSGYLRKIGLPIINLFITVVLTKGEEEVLWRYNL